MREVQQPSQEGQEGQSDDTIEMISTTTAKLTGKVATLFFKLLGGCS